MSQVQMEAMIKEAETLPAKTEQLKSSCRGEDEDVKGMQPDPSELAQNYEQAERVMEAKHKALSELMKAKIAFEARERQIRKLSKQL